LSTPWPQTFASYPIEAVGIAIMKPIDHQSTAVTMGIAERVRNLELPGRAGIEYASARDADRHILSSAPATYLDATKFDTVRFSPPDWAQEALAAAAADGSLAHTGWNPSRVIRRARQSD
jgi:hypothetical protein